MQHVKLQWATPEADAQIAYIARVSNPHMQDKPIGTLFNYMMREGHTSPFGQANACLEITAPRDISRQIMRHWSMMMHELEVQEFSQRYQSVDKLPEAPLRECRLQDTKNRQNSLETDDESLVKLWESMQELVLKTTKEVYEMALENGVAKEVARSVLPEGLTMSRFYLNGNFRSWIFFFKSRLHKTSQKEVRVVCQEALNLLRTIAPDTINAFFDSEGEFIDLQAQRITKLEALLSSVLSEGASTYLIADIKTALSK
jgi:thymidylate synthase (FAD)